MNADQIQSDIISPLKALLESRKELREAINRKRSIRASEKALWLVEIDHQCFALAYAITEISNRAGVEKVLPFDTPAGGSPMD